MRHPGRITGLVVAVLLAGSMAWAGAPQPVDNPYQGEFEFTPGEAIDPGVSIDGVVWTGFTASPQGELRPGKAVKTVLQTSFDNGSANDVRLLVVVLFEDEQGESLDRIELDPVNLAAGRSRSFRQKVKIQSDVLSSAAKVYLFCEVRPR